MIFTHIPAGLRFLLRYEVLILLPMRHKICPAERAQPKTLIIEASSVFVCRSRKTSPDETTRESELAFRIAIKHDEKKCTKPRRVWRKKSPTANKTLYDAVKNLFMAIARALMWSLLFYVAMIYASIFFLLL